jgi:hypothetical protein
MSRIRLAVLVIACLAALAVPASAAAFGPITSFGTNGSGAGQIRNEGSLGVAPDGSLYVSDYGNGRISVFTATGNFDFAFGKEVDPAGGDVCTISSGCRAGEEIGSAGALNQAESLAFDSAGNVFVADGSNNRVDVFSAAGEFIYAFGKEVNATDNSDLCTAESGCQAGAAAESAGALHLPKGIGIEGERVYVPENDNARVSVFSTAGTFLYAFGKKVNTSDNSDVCTALSGCKKGEEGEGAGQISGPFDAKPVPGGQLVISDENNHRIDVFTTGGAFVRAYGREVNASDNSGICTVATGCRAGETDGSAGSLLNPSPVSVDPAGNVYVGDTGYERVAEFNSAGSFVRAFGAGVVNGAEAFQICTLESGCMAGREATSSGSTPHPYGVAADCRGAVFVTEETGGFARVERFGEPGTPIPPCPPASAPPAAAPIATQAAPSNNFKFGKLTLNTKKGTATLSVKVPGPGSLVLKGKGIHTAKHTAKKSGNVKLPVKLAGGAKRKLLAGGKAEVVAKVAFTPTAGTPLTKKKALTLKKTLR